MPPAMAIITSIVDATSGEIPFRIRIIIPRLVDYFLNVYILKIYILDTSNLHE